MRPSIRLATALGCVLLAVAAWAARPAGEFQLIQTLNGEPTRDVTDQANDGGARLDATSGVASCSVVNGGVYMLVAPASAACPNGPGAACANICFNSQDGGCSSNPIDLNYGVPLVTGGVIYHTAYSLPGSTSQTTAIKGVATDGGAIMVPAFRMR